MIDMLAWGFGLIEGPRPDAEGNLYFSDVTRGGVHRLAPDGSVTIAVPKRRGVGGIAVHADGGLVMSGRNICHVRDGETRIVFELPDVGGFNDLFTDAAGRVYVGSFRDDPFSVGEDRKAGEAYRIDTDGTATQIYGDVGLTNGIGFSPDGRRIYHSDSAIQSILVHDDRRQRRGRCGRAARCSLGSRVACPTDSRSTPTAACGSRSTAAAASSATRPTARPIGSIAVPAEAVTSLVFAGPELVRPHRRHRGQHCSSGAGGHDLPRARGRGRCPRSAGAARPRLTSDHEHPPAPRRGGAERRCAAALVPPRPRRSAASAPRRARQGSASDGRPSPGARGARTTRRLPRCTRRRTSAFVMPNGGLATTWKSRRGRRRSAASASTTTMSSPNSARSCAALRGWSSTAMTRAPVSTSGRVSAPQPAPTSTTRSPGPSPASATSCCAQRGSS